MARALYKDSPIMILDEPTAALDPVTEFEFIKSLMKFLFSTKVKSSNKDRMII